MSETFITRIHVDRVRNIQIFDIPISDSERKNLIVTGKNGSGKTSLLEAINQCLCRILYSIPQVNPLLNSGVDIKLHPPIPQPGKPFVMAFFDAKRQVDFLPSEGGQQLNLHERVFAESKIRQYFLQYLVHLKVQRSFARDDGDEAAVKKIDAWFSQFETRLQDVFEAKDLKLIFDRKNYNFLIKVGDQEPFSLWELSDGYSSVVCIIAEIILRIEAMGGNVYDVAGVVIIDEIETHLHVELQKKILPFLCDFFPKIQFIVSTHSPFVLSSIQNAVICDLQNRIVTQDLSGYSYGTLIESYFKADNYSEELKRRVARYEALADKPDKTDAEMDEYFELKDYLSDLPKYFAPEMDVKLKQIELKHFS